MIYGIQDGYLWSRLARLENEEAKRRPFNKWRPWKNAGEEHAASWYRVARGQVWCSLRPEFRLAEHLDAPEFFHTGSMKAVYVLPVVCRESPYV